MNKKTITLFSIPTLLIALVLAAVVLLVGNYVKNFNSGINLNPQVLEINTSIVNDTTNDKVWLALTADEFQKATKQNLTADTFTDHILLGITSIPQPNTGYGITLDNVRLRGTQVNINYHIYKPVKDMSYAEVITYPQLCFRIAKENLPIGTPLEFRFTNLTNKTHQIIQQTLTL